MLGTDDELREILANVAFSQDAPVRLLLVGGDHRVRYLSQFDHGFTRDQVIGHVVEELVPEEFSARVREAVDAALNRGEKTTYETRVDTPRGATHYRTAVGPVRVRGDIVYASLVATEVTSEYRAQAAANRERALLAALDRVNRILITAPASEGALGAVLSETLELFNCDRAFLVHPCDPSATSFAIPYERTTVEFPGAGGAQVPMTPVTSAAFARCLEHIGQVVQASLVGEDPLPEDDPVVSAFSVKSMLFTAFRPAGDTPWILGIHHCREARVYDNEMPILAAVGARIADAIVTLLAQDALVESEERFRLLIENAPEAIVIFDADAGRFVQVNQRAVELFGMPREELEKREPIDVSVPVQPDGAASEGKLQEQVEAALRGEARLFEWHHRNAGGEVLECEVRLLRLPHKRQRWLRGSILHIAERKRAERENERLSSQLAQAQKMQALGQLTGGVAHDFNNLLMVVAGSLEMIERAAADPSRVRHFAELATDACGRASQLTQRLLAFSRRQPLRPRPVNLGSLIRAMEALVSRTLGETIVIQVSVDEGLWACEVDPAQLESAILNLCINARDAMPHGGHLHIDASNALVEAGIAQDGEEIASGEYIRLTVIDDGEGMVPETLARAFEPFFTTKEVGKGSGLGLSMVYGFTKQSGGHAKLYSALDRGTRIELFLPRSRGAVVQERARQSPSPLEKVGHGEQVLVVEDDERLRGIILELLHQLGFRTLAADRGSAALELLAAESDIALLLSDVVLPGGMSGVEAARHARQLRPALPIVFMSGYTDTSIGRDDKLEEGVLLLEKPFKSEELAQVLCEALGKRSRSSPGSSASRGSDEPADEASGGGE